MALMGSWNGFDFEVSPTAVRGFTGLTIKGGSETEDKVSDKQKYVQRTNSAITEIALNVYLNAYMGCNVRDEALKFISTAMEGATNYFYVGGKKLVTYKLMLTNAEITETEIAPNGTWVACKIALTMKQCEKYGKSTNSSPTTGGSGSGNKTPAKQTVKSEGIVSKIVSTVKTVATSVVEGAKKAVSTIANALSGKKTTTTSTGNSSSLVSKAANFINNAVSAVKKTVDAGKAATKTVKKTTTTVKKPAAGSGKLMITLKE